MKTKSVINALNKILKGTKNERGQVIYTVGNKIIEVNDQGGNAIALPILDGVVFHNGKYTIKNLISFITSSMDAEKVEYLKTLRAMYSTTSNERLLEMANEYQSMTDVGMEDFGKDYWRIDGGE